MALSNYEIIQGATARWMTDFNMGLEAGLGATPFMDHVYVVEATESITDPLTGEANLIWMDPDGELEEDQGEVKYVQPKMRRVQVPRREFSKGISETLPRLRVPLVQEQPCPGRIVRARPRALRPRKAARASRGLCRNREAAGGSTSRIRASAR